MRNLIAFTLIAVIYEAVVANAQQKTTRIVLPKYNGDHVVEIGKEFKLECQGKDKTTPLVWQKMSNVTTDIQDGTLGFKVVTDSSGPNMTSTLSKPAMTIEDRGSYTCYPNSGNVNNGDAKTVRTIEIKTHETVFKVGVDITVKCEVIGITSWTRPIEWKRTQGGEVVEVKTDNQRIFINSTTNGSLIEIRDAKHDDYGNYTCVVYVHNKTLSFEQDVPVFRAPHVKEFEKSKNLVQGDTLRLNCKAEGDPTPTVEWFKDGAPFSHKNAEYKDSAEGVTNASLTLPNLDFEDKGEYECFAENIHGNNSAKILVRVKDKLAALWPFLGICAEVAILCTIIFIYERRRAKKIEEEEAKEEAGHLTNSHDHKGQEVRQRK